MRVSFFLACVALLATSCSRQLSSGYQGYLEGEFVYVGSPLAGRLETLSVTRGTRVEAGAPLFTLERVNELAAQRQAADQLRSTQARLEDLKKGSRPSELASLEARLGQARATAELSRVELVRQEGLFKNQIIAAADFDRARLTHERDTRAVADLSAQVETARLGGRSDAITAAESDVSAAAAAKEKADWSVAQKAQTAPRAALVYDTLYREGEYVTAGNPVVALLPPENIKVRFFVPETDVASLKTGDRLRVTFDGGSAIEARLSYVSPKPEYTPPILYNRASRAKLVFMIEALFNGTTARDLHPGQPVEVTKVGAGN